MNLFSTRSVPVSDRLQAWQYTAKQICGDCRFVIPSNAPFHGSIQRKQIAGLEFTRFSSSSVSFAKVPRDYTTPENRFCIIISQLEGARRYHQNGNTALLEHGDTTIIDASYPWTSDCPGSCGRLYLRVPRWMVENRLRTSALPLVPRISGAHGIGATLFGLINSLYQEAESLSMEEASASLDAYFGVLKACLSPSWEGGESRGADVAGIQRLIDNHLAQPDLSPTHIASAFGLSVRHLHRVFSPHGYTVTEWIKKRRLQRCRADLKNPELAHLSITDIAFLWGFSDSAHFSRSFKKEFGVSPRSYRGIDGGEESDPASDEPQWN